MTFYARLRQNERRRDSDELAACIERVVNQLEQETTTGDRPGMLLGKIQSGKTRGFIGVIARGFDHGFDIALVLTKGTKTLSAQTVARLNADFEEFINEDELLVLDIMKLPGKLTRSELKRKIVIVAKKQAQNLERLTDFIKNNAELQNRRVLLIDDEADLASIRFIQKRGNVDMEQGKIAEKMDALRRMVNDIAFLQVTATPYSLYLQPEGYETSLGNRDYIFKPKKPAFTELLPIHAGYVGGNDYFSVFDEENPRARLYVEVDQKEQDSLRNQDKQRISASKILDNSNIVGLRRAIITLL
ncbi:MAG: DEAD/DEAH box helicase family protein [Proteobacteria bacterium]|nr:DEAD/DEAH box helicase family protein [Pseudomonadota bacterium]